MIIKFDCMECSKVVGYHDSTSPPSKSLSKECLFRNSFLPVITALDRPRNEISLEHSARCSCPERHSAPYICSFKMPVQFSDKKNHTRISLNI